MKKRRILIALAAAVLLALFFRAYQRAALLPGQLNGTYTLGDVPPYQLIFSANTREGVFYYTDQGNSRYITGRITPGAAAPTTSPARIRTMGLFCRTRSSPATA